MTNTETAKKVLIVDDEEDILELAEAFFSIHGLKVIRCLSAEAALEIVKKEPVAAIVSDIQLSGMSGVELYNQLVAKDLCHQPFVLMTAFALDHFEFRNLRTAIPKVFFKPFSFNAVAEHVIQEIKSLEEKKRVS